jgi:hypothetical protein
MVNYTPFKDFNTKVWCEMLVLFRNCIGMTAAHEFTNDSYGAPARSLVISSKQRSLGLGHQPHA